MIRNGSAQTRPVRGIGGSSMTRSHRNPPAVTTWPWLKRTGSREIPQTVIFAPQRRSSVSSLPMTTGPSGVKAWTSRSSRRWAT
jgi:hypothetical protein